jgi:hypothetical protein
MQPKREPEQPQRELFQIDLEQLIDMSHPLVCLGLCIDWHSFEQSLGSTYHPELSNSYKAVQVPGVLSTNSPCATKMYSGEPNISSGISPKLPGNELADHMSNETASNPIHVTVHHMPGNAT